MILPIVCTELLMGYNITTIQESFSSVQRVKLHDRKSIKITVVTAVVDDRCPQKPLLSLPSSAGQERENTVKVSWLERRTGGDHSPLAVMDRNKFLQRHFCSPPAAKYTSCKPYTVTKTHH